MTCEDLRSDYLPYALGALDEPERGEIAAHLARGCEACAAGLRDARALAYSMGAAVNGPEPPRDLRSRVLAIAGEPHVPVRPSPPRRPAFWFRPLPVWQVCALAAGCAALALVPGLLWVHELSASSARQAALAAMLEREQRSAASLRAQVNKLNGARPDEAAAPHAVPIFALEMVRGAGTAQEPPQQIAIPLGTETIVLALPIDLLRQASAAELRNASGQTIWTGTLRPAIDSDSAGLTVPARLLPPGRYSVMLTAGPGKNLARLPFRVTASHPGA